MKSFLLFALYCIVYATFAAADCPDITIQTQLSCVDIRTNLRNTFCATKPEEFAKCQCVYDTFIKQCYDQLLQQNCVIEPQVQTEMKQLDSTIQQQCASAQLDPENIPANVYNNIITPETQQQATQVETTGNTQAGNQGTSNLPQMTNDDINDGYDSGANTVKVCAALLVANIALAALLL